MKRNSLALLVVLALALAACGGDGADTTTTAGAADTTEAAPDTTEAGGEEPTTTAAPDTTQPVEVVDVRLRLNWVLAGNHAPYFLAQSEGYWEACGLNVTMNPGQGSGDTAQLVGTGAEEFGLTDGVSITAGRSQGLPIQSIGVVYEDNPSSLVSYTETGITDLAGVEGKTFGAVPGGSPYLLLQALFEQNDIDVSSINEVSVSPPGIAELKTGAVDFITFFGNEAANIDDPATLNVLYFRDFGLESYGLALAASEDTIAEHPEWVQCMVDGVRRGFEEAEADPAKALAALYAAAPETEANAAVHEQLLQGAFEFAGEEFLSQNLDKWTATQDFLVNSGVIENPVEPETLFTDAFSG